MKTIIKTAAVLALLTFLSPNMQAQPKVIPPVRPSNPLAPVQTPTTTTTTTNQLIPNSLANLYLKPVDMKLLVLSADGTEPSFEATKSFLDYMAIPYDAVILKTTPLPALNDASKGFYQGIVLSTGNLALFNGTTWGSALTVGQWALIDNYMTGYSVRVASMYTFPEPRYGLTMVSALSPTPTSPLNVSFPAAAASIYPYINRANTVPVTYAYTYLANATPAAGETTTPFLSANGYTVGATHKKVDGREFLALTMDQSPFLVHSLALNYGVFNWVTKGVFVGEKRIYMNPQVDDFFLANNLYTAVPAACRPTGFLVDPTADFPANCPERRMTNKDLSTVRDWQAKLQQNTQFKNFKIAMAFNAFGLTTDGGAPQSDTLKTESVKDRNDFFWLSHTFDHENLDCYNPVPNSGICTPATYAQSAVEIAQNISSVSSLGLPIDKASMVTPGISGLTNVNFLQAAADNGLRYLVSDMSRTDWRPAKPNTGVRSPFVPAILYIPRRATNIFYNTDNGNTGAVGSLVDEYNYFYGPNGLLKITGTTQPFFTVNQTYSDIINRESDQLLQYMLRGELYPTMYHQANLINYSGGKTLITDTLDAAFTKFQKLSNLPVLSFNQSDLGKKLEDRMALLSANTNATYKPGIGITITSTGAASAPITGICSGACETYGGTQISKISVPANGTVNIPLF